MRPRVAPLVGGKSGDQWLSAKPPVRSGPQARSGAELVRLFALPGATAVGSLLHLQRSAGNSAASGLVRLLLSGRDRPRVMSCVDQRRGRRGGLRR
ncbi:MAG: hypothetical protein ACRDSL_20745 [Pseudonocardiaceae bacterium]